MCHYFYYEKDLLTFCFFIFVCINIIMIIDIFKHFNGISTTNLFYGISTIDIFNGPYFELLIKILIYFVKKITNRKLAMQSSTR